MTTAQKKDIATAAIRRLEEAADVLRRSVKHVDLEASMLDRITNDANTAAAGLEVLADFAV